MTTPEIFIQIAAYRDGELLPTMQSALDGAARPERLSFGVCFQEKKESADYRALLRFPRCRVVHIEPEKARGVCAARALTQTLYRGERYTLQIDSHMRFVKGWDEALIEMHRICGDRAILTAYCPAYQPGEPLPKPTARSLGADYFNAYGSLMLCARMPLDGRTSPARGAFWSGHFSFAMGSVIAEIPYDPQLYFHGEEITYAARAWTRGYELYYPNRAVCYHYYGREGRGKHWEDQRGWLALDMLSQQRVRRLLGVEKSNEDFGRFGLGSARSLAQYERFSGVDFAAARFSARAWNGWYEDEYPKIAENKARRYMPNQKILFATAFCDTGREGWTAFRRDKGLYLEWFSYLAGLRRLKLVCYYDKAAWSELPPGDYALRDFDRDDTFFRDYLEKMRAVMSSPEFRALIGARGQNPEHCRAEYAVMTHAKVNFVRRASEQYPGYTHYAWIDFGVARRPYDGDTALDWRRLMDDKIHMQVFAPPCSFPSDPVKLCQQSPDALSASLFVVPKGLIGWYEAAYEEELKRDLALGIADDEQNLMLRLAQKHQDRISADPARGWYGFFEDAIGAE